MTTRNRLLSFGWAAVGVLVIALGALRADAAWQLTGNGNSIDYDSNGAPVNGNGDGLFKRTLAAGTHGISFFFTFCCTDPSAICPSGQTLGVSVRLSVKVVTFNGVTDSITTLPIVVCSPCGTTQLSLTEALTSINGVQGAAWGQKAVQLSVDAAIECICCLGGTWNLSLLDTDGTTGWQPLNWY